MKAGQIQDTLLGGTSGLVPDFFEYLQADAAHLLRAEVREVGAGFASLLEIRSLLTGSFVYYHPPSNSVLSYEERLGEGEIAELSRTLRSKRPSIHNPSTQPKVSSIEYYVTNACNLRCPYCYLGPLQTKPDTADERPAGFLSRLRDLFESDRIGAPLFIHFIGGEPLLAFTGVREVVQAVETMAEQYRTPVRFSMITNGYLLDEPIVDFLLKHRIKLKASFDGRFHGANRPSKTGETRTFEDALPYLQFLDLFGGVTINATLVEEQFSFQAEVFEEILEAGFRSVQVSVTNAARWTPRTLQAYFRGSCRLARRCIDLDLYELHLQRAISVIRTGKLRRSHCGAGVSHLAFNSQGEMQGCSTSFNSELHSRDPSFGAYDVDDDPHCNRCAFRYACAGGCRAFKIDGRPEINDCAPIFLNRLLAVGLIGALPGFLGVGTGERRTAADSLAVTV